MTKIGRRAALLGSLTALSACSAYDWATDQLDDWFGSSKAKLPGKRESVMLSRNALGTATTDRRPVVLPPQVANAEWAQQGGNAAHVVGNPAAPSSINVAWKAEIGEGASYRRRLTSQPIVAGGMVYTFDADAVVSAFDFATGKRVWTTSTQGEKDRSTNVGGGICAANNMIYATTGRAELLALDASTGEIRWRQPTQIPARSAPTFAEGRLFMQTSDDRFWAASTTNGLPSWSFQSRPTPTTVLGSPAPAYADNIAIGAFPSGELVAFRAATGQPLWSENLISASGRNSAVDLPSIHGAVAIDRGRVFAIGLGGVLLSLDLRIGRRLWERQLGGINGPWVAGDWLFVLDDDQVISAIHRDDGGLRWSTELPRWGNPERKREPISWYGPVLAGGRLIAVGSTGEAVAINPVTGELIGTQKLSGAASVAPIVVGGTVLILTDDGTLLALR